MGACRRNIYGHMVYTVRSFVHISKNFPIRPKNIFIITDKQVQTESAEFFYTDIGSKMHLNMEKCVKYNYYILKA